MFNVLNRYQQVNHGSVDSILFFKVYTGERGFIMTIPVKIHEVGYAMVKEQLNNQPCLQVSLSEEELEKIPRHTKNGKKFIDISIRINTIQMCMDGKIDFTPILYCKNYMVNDSVPLFFKVPTFDSAVNWGWNSAVPIARCEIQEYDETNREFCRDYPKLE